MPRIQVLPPGLVNQIAAGEVVERPASVVKELVETALDAGARAVQVEVEDGGLSLVRVADDGSGMERDDALLALECHATAKLRDASGLAAIATMGFRGEALPAIASVARLRLDTCPGGDGAGTRISVEGGRVLEVAEVARARGTTIEVRDLFFNTPARRKFVRAPATEAGDAAEAALRLALARCDVAFLLRSGGRVAWSFAAGSPLGERAAAGLGREACGHLMSVDAARGEVRVRGLVTGPDHSQPTSRSLYLRERPLRAASRGKRGRRKKSLNAVWRRLASKKMRACADSSEPWLPFPSPQSPRSRSRLPRNTISFCSIPPIPVVDKQGGLC